MSRKLAVWESNHLIDCEEKNLFAGNDVLEVGGVIPMDCTEKLGVKSWTCIDHAPCYQSFSTPKYSLLSASIIDHPFEPESFDFVISTNSFEHINQFSDALTNMYRLLKRGGQLSALFGPIWSCHKGHHIWLKDEEGNVTTFNDGLMPDWAHLLYNEEELADMFEGKLSQYLVDQLIYQTYNTDFLNRMFCEDYIRLIKESEFKILELRDWHKPVQPDAKIQKILEEKCGYKNFSSVSLKILLEKP